MTTPLFMLRCVQLGISIADLDLLTIGLVNDIADGGRGKKKPRKSERVMTTPLFMLRCVQLGISIADLDLLTIGLVNDMFTERQNDEYPYRELASQADFDKF